jgi:class 3 adenylate cyclase/predicted ATPase
LARSFDDALKQTIAMLRDRGRVSYRALRREFDVDDSYIDDLKSELVDVLKLAEDENGQVLVWAESPSRPAGGGLDEARREATSRTADPRPPAAEPPAPSASPRREAERRHLTVMFCDLVDSTPLAERLDPEELADVFALWQVACNKAMAEHGGHIADYRGDGIFVYFGYPSAYEDGPHRAIRAALALLRHLRDDLNVRLQKLYATMLSVRIGIHTGLVMLSDLGGQFQRDQFALGETLNVAARLQAVAEPDQIIVSGSVRDIVRGFFDLEELEARTLKGVSRAIAICRVLGTTGATDRLQAAGEQSRTPFTGRGAELAALLLRRRLSADGRGQAVLLTGEAGIGKSRLVQKVVDLAENDGDPRIILRCSSYHGASPLHPVIEYVEHYLNIERDESVTARFAKLHQSLADSGSPDPQRDAELIAGVLGLPIEEMVLPPTLPPQQRRAEAFEALRTWPIRAAKDRPLLFVVEDLHWADPSTLEYLGLMLSTIGSQRVFLLMTSRPEHHPEWMEKANLTLVPLSRLADSEGDQLIDQVLRGKTIPPELREQIVARADGVPLFIEELVAMLLGSGMLREEDGVYALLRPVSNLPIPTTLQDLLAARLDRIGEAREAAQLAAALGRDFSFELISAVSPWETSALLSRLDKLVDSELIQQQGVAPSAVYRFQHALFQDAAYQSMLKTRRQQYHQLIAQTLAEKFAETIKPEILAHHYTEAGLAGPAIRHWREAGEWALKRSANQEALLHIDRGLALVDAAADRQQHRREEMLLQLARGTVLLFLKGQSAAEVVACFERAHDLSHGLGDTPELFLVLFGLWRTRMSRGWLVPARDSAEQMQEMAERLGDRAFIVGARCALSLALFHLCDLQRSLSLAASAVAIYDSLPPNERESPIFNLGQHPALASYLCMSFITLLTGAAEQSVRYERRGLDFARATGMPFQIANATGWGLLLASLRRDSEAALENADRVLTLAKEHGFPQWQLLGGFQRGLVLVEQGAHAEGLALARESFVVIEKIDYGIARVRCCAQLAQAEARAGHVREGLAALRSAFASLDQSGERWWEPELHRLQGELGLLSEDKDGPRPEDCFRHALEVASGKELWLFALRAAASLARLLKSQGRIAEARQILSRALGKFKEGFGIRDVVEARALLDTLRGGDESGASQELTTH